VDVRYRGQGYELNVPYTGRLIAAFRREHERHYGYSYPAREIELVTLRLRAIMKSPQSSLSRGRVAPTQSGGEPEQTSIFFDTKKITARIHDRDSLQTWTEIFGSGRGHGVQRDYGGSSRSAVLARQNRKHDYPQSVLAGTHLHRLFLHLIKVNGSGQEFPLYSEMFQSGYNRGNIVTARLQYPCETKHLCG
jgi:hypothetical protein